MQKNQAASYDIIQESNTDYRFITDNDCVYSIKIDGAEYLKGISPDLFLYEFSFAKATGAGKSFDPKVKTTIVNLINENLKNPHVSLFYVCETIDTKEDYRKRLFERWFRSEGSNKHTIHTYPIRSEYSTIYISVIVCNSNPHYEAVVSELNQTMTEYMGDK